jgi:hypothetical protein
MTHAEPRLIRPVLTAMMVYVMGLGVVALLGVIAMWRAPAACPLQRGSPGLYVVQIPPADTAARI